MDKAIEELQLSLAQLDLLNRRSPKGGFEFLIIKKQNLKVKMYQEANHREPHVHIDYGKQNHTACFAIRDNRMLVGNLDRKYEKTIAEWINNHRDDLVELWTTAQSGGQVHELIVGIRNA